MVFEASKVPLSARAMTCSQPMSTGGLTRLNVMHRQASAITIQCALRSHLSRRSASSRERDWGGQVLRNQDGPECNTEGLQDMARSGGADILCLDEDDSEVGSRPVTPPLPSEDGSRPATPLQPPSSDFQDSSNVTTEPQSTHVQAGQGDKTENQEKAVHHDIGMEVMRTQPALVHISRSASCILNARPCCAS